MSQQKKQSRSLPGSEGKMMSELPYKTLMDISDRLDLLKDGKTAYWRELATLMDYNHITVEKFGMQASKHTGSPGYTLLLDMSNKGVSYEELVSYLKRLELYDALVQIGYKEDVRITKHPVATPVMNGQKLRLECKAEGVPRPQYMWFQGQKPLADQKSPILEIDKVTPEHAGIYTCRVGNTANIVFSQWVEVQVQNPTNTGPVAEHGHNEDSPVVFEHPKPAVLEVGQKLYLNCQAAANGKLEYQWFLDGKELIYGTSQDLVIKQVQASDQGVYVCCIKSSNGASVLTKGAEVIVTPPGGPQIIPQQTQPQLPHPPPNHPAYPSMPPHAHMNSGMFSMDPSSYAEFPPPMHSSYPPSQTHMSGMPHPSGPPPTGSLGGNGLIGGRNMDKNQPAEMFTSHGPHFHHHSQGSINSPAADEPAGMSACMSPFHPGPTMSINSVRNLSPTSPSPHPQLIQGRVEDEGPVGQDLIDKPCADKVALLIGNKNYHVKSLRLNTPENDTQDLAGILRSADFKVVSLVNLTKKEMDEAIGYFTQLLGPNVYAVFFFAGHGFELNNMNYMMAVDCTKQKNPSYSVCAQQVLQIMQETKAKLSIVLLDMCRVVAPQDPITDMSGVYRQTNPKSYPGYFVYGFSCSIAEKAFEVASELGENSIFVAALKEYLQLGNGSINDTVETLFTATAKGVYKHRPANVNGQWQRPQIASNVAEDLSLADPIEATLLPEHNQRRSKRWKDAHSVPEPIVLGSNDGHLALRLHFEAEHTNVLIIQVEVLQGCLMETEVERMNVELILQEKPVSLILAGTNPQHEYSSCSIPVQKSIAKKNLLHFKVPDLQKITTPEVTLHISTNYRWRDSRLEESMWQFQMEHIHYRMLPPPLYGKVTFHEEEQRQQPPHFQDPPHRIFIPGGTAPPPSLHPLHVQ